MAVDLSDYVDVLRREITPPGSTLFADVTDDTLTSYLADAFWEARLDGLLSSWESTDDGIVSPVGGASELPRDRVALIVLYASIRMLRNHVLNLGTKFRAVAGPVEFETQNSANLLTDMLSQLKDTKNRLLDKEGELWGNTTTYVTDAYSVRNASQGAYFGFLDDYFASLGT